MRPPPYNIPDDADQETKQRWFRDWQGELLREDRILAVIQWGSLAVAAGALAIGLFLFLMAVIGYLIL